MRVIVDPEQIEQQRPYQRVADLGIKVKFADDRYWWTVQAVSENFTALTRARPFHPDETFYTVIDWNKGIRGPCDLIGQGYGEGIYDQDECAQMLQEFEQYLKPIPEGGDWLPSLQVSYRNRVALNIERVKP